MLPMIYEVKYLIYLLSNENNYFISKRREMGGSVKSSQEECKMERADKDQQSTDPPTWPG